MAIAAPSAPSCAQSTGIIPALSATSPTRRHFLATALGTAALGAAALRAPSPKHAFEDPALCIVQELEAIDAEFVSEDVDPEGNAKWLARWDRAFDRLPDAKATTSAGRAAKLRYAVEYIDTPRGDRLMAETIRYLEQEA